MTIATWTNEHGQATWTRVRNATERLWHAERGHRLVYVEGV